MMTYDIGIKLNETGTEIEVSTDHTRLSREEINILAKVLWEFKEQLEGIFNVEIDAEGWIEWKFGLYVLDYGRLSENYSEEEVEQVRKKLVDLITRTLSFKSIMFLGGFSYLNT